MTRSLSPQEAQRQLAAGEALLIDVREPAEFAASHIPLAVSLPLSGLPGALAQLPRDRTLIFQCQSGMRSAQACALAAQRAESVSLDGGIVAWRAAGLPIVGNAGPRLSIFRQVQMIVGMMVALLVLAGFAGLTVAFAIAGIMGAMLAFAGATGWCGLAMLLARMPWNRAAPAS
ncbi:rhodanese-like domain-containing protein [Bosea sp. RAF48]|jgi:rhodanese-related sulfurtransferase|uniref:rhodanese-like domain-containing protein n=1 Tax=Bosea sp. RAF48 TaxID=3237480 RepID=UPI003F9076BA